MRLIAILAALGMGAAAGSQAAAGEPAGDPPRSQIVRVVHNPPAELPSIGPRHAPVTIEFFCNLGDGAQSGRVHQLLLELAERHPRRLRILYRLVTSNTQSNGHVEAGLEAFAQGRFRGFVDAMYGERFTSPRAGALAEIAERAGMDIRRLEQAQEDGRHADAIRANHYYGKRHRLRRSPPGVMINGVPLEKRPRSIDELEGHYDEAYRRGKELLDRGVEPPQLYRRLLEDALAERPDPLVGPGAVDGLRLGERPPVGPAPLIALPDAGEAASRGPASAPVPVVFFCNFQTKNCGEMARMLDELRAAYPDEVRLVFRPLFEPGERRQRHSRALHQAATCADQQHHFWSFYERVFRRAREGRLGEDSLEELVRTLDLDPVAFARCQSSAAVRRKVEQARKAARAAGVSHTPAVVIGGRLYTGTKSFGELSSLVDRQLVPGVLGRLAPD